MSGRELGFSDERWYHAIWRDCAVPLVVISNDGAIQRANQAASNFLGYAIAELEGLTLRALTHPTDLSGALKMLEQAQSRQVEAYSIVQRFLTKQGAVVWAQVMVTAVYSTTSLEALYASIIPLPNHGKFKVEEGPEGGGRDLIVRPSLTIGELIKDNSRFFVTVGITILTAICTLGWRVIWAFIQLLDKSGIEF